MKKKSLSLALALVMCLGLIIPAFADGTTEKVTIKIPGSDITFTLENVNSEYGIVSGLSEPVQYCGGALYLEQGSAPAYFFTFPGREGRVTCDTPACLDVGGIYYMESGSDKACVGGGELEKTGAWEASYDFGSNVGTSYTAIYVSKDGTLSMSFGSEPLAIVIFAFGYPINTAYGERIDDLSEDLLPTESKRHDLFELAVPDAPASAVPTNDKLTANGALQTPTVYKIDGSNYFKIRDLAAILNGTEKQFSVGYDSEKQSVTAATGQEYTMTGTELKGAAAGAETAEVSNDAIYVNGEKIEAQVYKIGGMNYFKLRDLGKALDFYVGYDSQTGMFIETDKPYTE